MPASTPTIVYDWNGTLFDDTPVICRCFSIIVERFGHPPLSLDRFREHYDIPIDRFFRSLGLSETDIGKIGNNLMGDFHENYEPAATTIPLREGAKELLSFAHAQKFHQVILSNHIVGPIRNQVIRLGIEPYIDCILANVSKERQFLDGTKDEWLQRYLHDNRLNPGKTIFIGDSHEETRIARKFGGLSVAITGGFVSQSRLDVAEPDHVIHALTEMPDILQQREIIP